MDCRPTRVKQGGETIYLYIMLMWHLFVCLFVCHVSSSYNFSYFHSDDDRNVDDGDTKKKKV